MGIPSAIVSAIVYGTRALQPYNPVHLALLLRLLLPVYP